MAKKNFTAVAEQDAVRPVSPRLELPDASLRGTRRLGGAVVVAIDRLVPDPEQVRKGVDHDSPAMRELADSICAHGVLQPLTVFYRRGDDVYQLISGERRLHAARLAGIPALPCLVRDRAPSAAETTQLQLIENLHREGMHPIEEAEAYRVLSAQHGLTLVQIGAQVGKSKSYVSKSLRLCALDDAIKREVATSQHAKKPISFEALLEVAKKNPGAEQRALFDAVVREGLNVRQLRARVAQGKRRRPTRGRPKSARYRYRSACGAVTVTVQLGGEEATQAALVAALQEAIAHLESGAG